jgi:uncharacterized protein YjbI with pentapeptide repeats
MSDAEFENSIFYEAEKPCIFNHADLSATKFVECDIRLAIFEQTRLFRATFLKTNATGANFYRAQLSVIAQIVECIFRLADLRDADLRNCDLHKTSFEQADLRNARLNDSNLTECDFAGVIAHHMQITGADLRGANIAQLNLCEHDFTRVTIYEEQGRILLENAGLLLENRESRE